jgi:hypothetical protein
MSRNGGGEKRRKVKGAHLDYKGRAKRAKCIGIYPPTPRQPLYSGQTILVGPQGVDLSVMPPKYPYLIG